MRNSAPVIDRLFVLNRLPWYARLPVKWGLFGLVVLVVCFPYPSRLIDHLRHCRDPDRLIEPHALALKPMIEELQPVLTDELAPKEALRRVERFVYRKIPYEWDWNTWGVADYLPTVTEVIERGQEDCDGRAVVAASLLRNFGFNAHLVNDLTHMWVRTEAGDTMSPGERPVAVATEHGLEIRLPSIGDSLRALAFGVAVFPRGRELIILFALWLLLLRRDGGAACSLAALTLMIGGLLLTRYASRDFRQPLFFLQLTGAAAILVAVLSQILWARRNALAAAKLAAARDDHTSRSV